MSHEGAATDSLTAVGGAEQRHWPGRETWTAFVRYAILIQLLWTIVYVGCAWLTAHRTLRVPLSTTWDARIPFVPEAAAVYLSLGPMLWLSPFMLKSTAALRNFAKSLAWLIVVSGIGFLLLPADAPASSERAAAPSDSLMDFADMINLDHNLCPSLHVGMAVVCAVAYSRYSRRTRTVLMWTWATAIAVSTLLIRDHYICDVLAGAVIGYVVADRAPVNSRWWWKPWCD